MSEQSKERMATKVFISWSETPSRQLAAAIDDWLPNVLQSVTTYFAPNEVAKGQDWLSSVTTALGECEVGILCLTRYNLNSPWTLFEAGALASRLGPDGLCPLLFDVKPADLPTPLALYPCTTFSQSGVRGLLHAINDKAGNHKLPEAVLDNSFSLWWERLKSDVNDIVYPGYVPEKKDHRTDRELLEELLAIARERQRAEAASKAQLVSRNAVVHSGAPGFVNRAKLIAQIRDAIDADMVRSEKKS